MTVFKKGLFVVIFILVFVFSFSVFFNDMVSAETLADATEATADSKEPLSGGKVQLDNPLGPNADSPAKVANQIIKTVIGLTGVFALIAFIWGGIMWMTSGGSPDRIKKGKTMMIWAILGLLVIFGSYAILKLIFTSLSIT